MQIQAVTREEKFMRLALEQVCVLQISPELSVYQAEIALEKDEASAHVE